VSGANLSRAARSIAYALARASPPVRYGGVIQTAQNSTGKDEASLRIALADGLKPDGGARNKGDLFKQTELNRGALPYASAQA
jgi:hypothetical protein